MNVTYREKRLQIRGNIISAAESYEKHLLGKCFMFVFGNQYIEVLFEKKRFKHLTGVGSVQKGNSFFRKALCGTLMASQIYFDKEHPYDLAKMKTDMLSELYRLTNEKIMIGEDVVTVTASYKFGLANHDIQLVLCLGYNKDKNGNLINSFWVPYSVRIEELSAENQKECDFIISRPQEQTLYSDITYSAGREIENLPKVIKSKIVENLSSSTPA